MSGIRDIRSRPPAPLFFKTSASIVSRSREVNLGLVPSHNFGELKFCSKLVETRVLELSLPVGRMVGEPCQITRLDIAASGHTWGGSRERGGVNPIHDPAAPTLKVDPLIVSRHGRSTDLALLQFIKLSKHLLQCSHKPDVLHIKNTGNWSCDRRL
ncbi:hypothetical protein EVAR_56219_1 [Eumeta japonica]|uniref:Uncharacterized protein n=1 Tax=Eumeta variegata TaxID=151549 RepID=A0A4C1YXA5_EUMVA|nr:hypothetical protein EVAR_56219_1 [Eumeta japonica]